MGSDLSLERVKKRVLDVSITKSTKLFKNLNIDHLLLKLYVLYIHIPMHLRSSILYTEFNSNLFVGDWDFSMSKSVVGIWVLYISPGFYVEIKIRYNINEYVYKAY